MNGYREEIPKWAWYTGQFLFWFEDQLGEQGGTSIADSFAHFKESLGLQNCPGFHLKSQGTMLMLLYGLLVVPREMWNYQGLPEFQFGSRNSFAFEIGNQQMNGAKFLRLMRNAVAHANFDIVDPNAGIYRFWNVPDNGNMNFAVRISHVDLGRFIAEVGQYYINEVLPHVQQRAGQ